MTESVLYSFGIESGIIPSPQGLILDAEGDLYGTTTRGGTNCAEFGGCGAVFEMTP